MHAGPFSRIPRPLTAAMLTEIATLSKRLGEPLARDVALDDIAFDPFGNPSRFAEVCMVVRRPTGNVLLSIDNALAGGFAVNVDPRESRRDRIESANVLGGFAPESYVRLATSLDGLERRGGDRRGSLDLYPYLITLLLMIFLGEAMYANRV